MKIVSITRDFKLEQQKQELQFEGNLPLTVNYCRVGTSDIDGVVTYSQMDGIDLMLSLKFGWGNFDVIWVIETDTRSSSSLAEDGLSEGLALVLELIRNGYGQYLSVHSLDRITRKIRVFDDINEILSSNGVELLVASDNRECGSSGRLP